MRLIKNIQKIKLWWYRNFRVISQKKAEELDLGFYRNVYGDEINSLNCRSLWCDDKAKVYRVKELVVNGRTD